jgi:hypothetical protein
MATIFIVMTKIGYKVTRSQLCFAYAIELQQKEQACYMGNAILLASPKLYFD